MKKRIWSLLVGAVVVLAVAVVAVNATLRGSRFDSAIPVATGVASRGTLEDRVTGNGTFKPRVSVTVVSQVAGEVVEVDVREGSRVTAGQLMLRLRDDDYRLSREQARASLDAARRSVSQSLLSLRSQYRSAVAGLAEARRALDTNQALAASGATTAEVLQRSHETWQSAELAMQAAREQLNLRSGVPYEAEPRLTAEGDAEIVAATPEVEQATLALRAADANLERCSVRAPVAGTVTMVKPSIGDLASAATPLARIESLGDMLAEIQIDEVDVGKLREGLVAEIASDSLIGMTLAGVVESISPTISSLGATRASLVDVRITGADGGTGLPMLRSGASCSTRIRANVRDGVLLIPLSAFVTVENAAHVFALVPTGVTNRAGAAVFRLEQRVVRIGATDVSAAEVLEGLQEGDRIATGSLRLLRDGLLVTAP